MLMRMFVANEVAQLGGWLDWVAITLMCVSNAHLMIFVTYSVIYLATV